VVPYPTGIATELLIRRVVTILGLIGIAVIHVIDLPTRLPGQPLIAVSYLGLIGACLVLAEALARKCPPALWAVAATLAAGTVAAFATSRTIGLPGAGGGDDIGNWSEPLGVASLLVEALVVAVSLTAIARVRQLAVSSRRSNR
jgi:hypothetical protein